MFNINQNEQEKKLDWMYKGANSLVDREDYLLGRAADKTLDQLNAEEKQKQLGTTAPPKNHVEHECIPPSIRDYKRQQQLAEQVDLQAKLQEDPLLVIQKREEESRRQFLQNPVQLAKLQKALNKQQKKLNKKSNSSDEDLDNELAKKLNLLRNNPGINFYEKDKKGKKVKDLDIILMHKFNALKSKLTDDDLKDIMDGKVTDTDSGDEEMSNNQIKKEQFSDEEIPKKRKKKDKKVKKKSRKRKNNSSDSEDETAYDKSKKKQLKKHKKSKKHKSSEDDSSEDEEQTSKKIRKSKNDSKHHKKESKSKLRRDRSSSFEDDKEIKAYKQVETGNYEDQTNKSKRHEESKYKKYEMFIEENLEEFKNIKQVFKQEYYKEFQKTKQNFESYTSNLRHEFEIDSRKYESKNRSRSKDKRIKDKHDANSRDNSKIDENTVKIENYDRLVQENRNRSKYHESSKEPGRNSLETRKSSSNIGETSQNIYSSEVPRNRSIDREAPRNRSNSRERTIYEDASTRNIIKLNSNEAESSMNKKIYTSKKIRKRSSSKDKKYEDDRYTNLNDLNKEKVPGNNSKDKRERKLRDKLRRQIERLAKRKAKRKVKSESNSSSSDSSNVKRKSKLNEFNLDTLKNRKNQDSSDSSSNESDSKKTERIFGPQRPDFKLHENSDQETKLHTYVNSDSDVEQKKHQNFGLVKSDGTKIPLTKSKPIIKEKQKVKETSRKEEPRERRRKLTDAESEILRMEMMANAAIRDLERAKNLKIHRETDLKEASNADFNPDFVHKELLKSANNSTVESRIRANLNNIQRSGRDMNSHFSRRN